MLLDYFDFPLLLLSFAVFASLLYLWDRFFSLHGLPSHLPWAGADGGMLSRAKANKRSFFGLREIIQDGYEKYSKRNRVFILPNVVTGPEVVLPMTQMRWLLDQPDDVLNQNEVNRQFLHADRTMLHKNVIRDTVHGHVIRRELTKELDVYCNDIVEEIDHALTVDWGTDPNAWKEIAVYDTMLDVISRISNRVLVGDPLCRNKEYLERTSTFARGVVITAGLMNLTPAILQPLLCPFIMAYDTYQYWKITKFIFPIVKKRISKFRPGLDYKKPDYSEHNDYIQWALHDAFSHDDPQERTPQMITKRLSVLSFAAIQSSVITITNALFDIASSPSCADIQQSLRGEVKTVTASQPGEEWTRASLGKMHRLDSALRESMRLWGFISRGVMKMVVKREGVTIPSGEHLPYGSKVGVTAYGPHHDESIYPHAFEYDAFRFSRAIEDPTLFEKMFGSQDEAPKAPTMVTSNDHFMAFSHGRHACPGRFFAANQLKLLLAAISTKYEIEPIAERPENPWLNNTVGPPIWEKLRVRRRAETVVESVAAKAAFARALIDNSPDRAIIPIAAQKDAMRMAMGHNLLDPKVLHSLVTVGHTEITVAG